MSLSNHIGSDWQNKKSQARGAYSVFGLLEKREDLNLAIEKLLHQGFTRKDISVVMPEHFDSKIHKGGIFVSIHCANSDWMNQAKKLLEVSGAQDIASSDEPFSEEIH